jgi:sterol-4alpha-carboxylate 3-dehydrogenase (decarboxylating)
MWRLAQTYEKKQHKYQMGDNSNKVDYSYVGNIADAHILAADRICSTFVYDAPSPPQDHVSGEVFFLSDGVPRPYWDFPRLVWKHLGDDGKDVVVLPRWLCFVFAFFSEMSCKIFGGNPSFPKFAINYATREQWYSIEKVAPASLSSFHPSY